MSTKGSKRLRLSRSWSTLFLKDSREKPMLSKPLALKAILLAAAVSMTAPAHAQQAAPANAQPACLAPDYTTTGRMDWFLGLHPADDLLSAWCRIQTIPGAIRFNLLFPTTGSNKSWDTSFDGKTLPATKIIELIQSLLPVADGPAKDEKGNEFPKVLMNVVQLAADKAPDKQDLGFAPTHPSAKELVLWEPLVIRVKPIALAGQEFTLLVTLRPNLGLLSLGLQGKATDVRLNGWKGRMPLDGFFGTTCSSSIPFCEGIPEVVSFHAPWLVSEVRLEAEGDNMTAAAAAIIDQMANSSVRSRFLKDGKPPVFDRTTGTGTVTLQDDISDMIMEAKGGPGGTKSISIVWKENGNGNNISKQLDKAAELYRAGTGMAPKPPTVPDSLGRL